MDSMEIIERLLGTGKITKEDIEDVVNNSESEIRSITTILHSLACEEEHVSIEDIAAGKAGCVFYVEEQTDNPWNGECHKKWLRIIRHIIDGLKSYTDDKRFMLDNIEDIAVIVKWTKKAKYVVETAMSSVLLNK